MRIWFDVEHHQSQGSHIVPELNAFYYVSAGTKNQEKNDWVNLKYKLITLQIDNMRRTLRCWLRIFIVLLFTKEEIMHKILVITFISLELSDGQIEMCFFPSYNELMMIWGFGDEWGENIEIDYLETCKVLAKSSDKLRKSFENGYKRFWG